jgi:hypothetical protein
VQEQDPLGEISAAFFPPKRPPIAPAEINNTPCLQFSPLKDNQ